VLHQLYWLVVQQLADFKVATLVHHSSLCTECYKSSSFTSEFNIQRSKITKYNYPSLYRKHDVN